MNAQLVLAVAEEREVVVLHPLEQGLGLGDLVGADRRRVLVELGDDLPCTRAHRAPVVDRRPHVREDPLELRGELVERGALRLTVDLDVQQRLGAPFGRPRQELEQPSVVVAPDPDGRMDEDVDRVSATRERHGHRVDEEGHVVGDDLDDAVP